jgi:glycosyltransferase involved in cell wall biosynthesis
MTDIIHIVSRFDGIGGTEFHAASLAAALRRSAEVKLWADEATAAAPRYGAQPINTFGGAFPRGGTLVMVGTHLHPGLWLDHARPERLVVICNLYSARRIFAFLTTLERPTLPVAELAFMSEMLKHAIGLPGRISPTLIDLERYHPSRRQHTERFTIGRHSRDDALKHHPADASLYAMLSWAGAEIHLIGASHLQPALSVTPRLQVFPVGSQAPEDFLAGLDCFYYRTHPAWTEAGGRVVMEALASGVPVVAHPGGGYAEWIVEGENGFLAATQEGLYERLLELKNSPVTATRLGRNARESALRLCGGKQRETYLNWLLGVV